MIKAKTTDELHEIHYKIGKDFKVNVFAGSIHNLLWQIIVNRINENSECCFTDVYENGKLYLCRVFKNKSGYSNTHIEFIEGTTDKKASEICDYLNQEVFGVNKKESYKIVWSSMKN